MVSYKNWHGRSLRLSKQNHHTPQRSGLYRDVEMRPPIRSLTQCRVIACATNMCSAEYRVFIVREYWRTGSFKQCERTFRNKCGEGSVPTKSCIHKMMNKLRTAGSDLTRHTGGRKMWDRTVQDVNHANIKKLLRNVWVPSERLTLYIERLPHQI
jgi:hypothetical protein